MLSACLAELLPVRLAWPHLTLHMAHRECDSQPEGAIWVSERDSNTYFRVYIPTDTYVSS